MSVYFIRNKATGSVKIGHTTRPVSARLSNLQCACDGELEVAGEIPDGDAELERALHERFAKLRVRGEWFREAGFLRSLVLLCEGKRATSDMVVLSCRFAPAWSDGVPATKPVKPVRQVEPSSAPRASRASLDDRVGSLAEHFCAVAAKRGDGGRLLVCFRSKALA